jgi:ribonuclease D
MPDLPEQIVTSPEDLAETCAYLATCPRFGFDTEFVGEDTYHPRLCLVQVATPDQLLLIDPLSSGPLDAFWNLVVDPGHQVIVHAGREEVRLCRLWTGKTPGNLFDLQLAAGLVGLPYPLGHATLVYQLLGVQLAKGETLTEWRDRPLTKQQVRYAFDDVRFLLPLWERLSSRLQELGREGWAREEFARLADQAAPEEPSQEKWRKLRGLGSLDRRKLAMVRELFNWREQAAETKNRPARTIIRDDLIIEIVRRNPTRERDMQVIRGLPRRDLAAILGVVERARALPLDQCPPATEREVDPPQVGLVANVLIAVLGDLCVRRRLAANLVCSNNDVKLIVRARQQGRPLAEESVLASGWRSQNILPELIAVLEGKKQLRITNPASETPFSLEEVSE